MEYQFTCPECSNFIINHDTEETHPKTISCPYCKKTISTKGAEVFETILTEHLLHVRNTTMSSEMKPLTNKGLYNIKI